LLCNIFALPVAIPQLILDIGEKNIFIYGREAARYDGVGAVFTAFKLPVIAPLIVQYLM